LTDFEKGRINALRSHESQHKVVHELHIPHSTIICFIQ
jgi:hypothetical protein